MISIRLERFRVEGEDGQAAIYAPSASDISIAWVHFSKNSFQAEPGVWTNVTMTIQVPPSATLGYYYAILFEPSVAKSSTSNTIKSANAILVLLNTNSKNEQKQLRVGSFAVQKKLYEFLPANFTVTVRNSGNIHLIPEGDIYISRQRNGKAIASLPINSGQGNVLPDSTRQFDVQWNDGFPVFQLKRIDGQIVSDSKGQPIEQLQWNFSSSLSKIRFGKYYAHLVLVYSNGHEDIPINSYVSFWVIPWKLIILLIVALVAVGLLWKFIKKFMRKLWKIIRRKITNPRYPTFLGIAAGLIVLAIAIANHGTVFAAGPAGPTITTSPISVDLAGKPGVSTSTVLQVQNNAPQAVNISVKLEEFRATGDNGQAQIYTPSPGDVATSWVHFSRNSFVAQPGVWNQVTMTIALPKTAAYGYYYAVLFAPSVISSTPNNVTNKVKSANAILVLLNAHTPNENNTLSVRSYSSDKASYQYLPAGFSIHVHNQGNIYTAPSGDIYISRTKNGKPIDTININQAEGNVLPGTNRVFHVTWTNGFPVYQYKRIDGQIVSDSKGQPVQQLQWNLTKIPEFRYGKYYAKLVLVYNNGSRDIPINGEVSLGYTVAAVATAGSRCRVTVTWSLDNHQEHYEESKKRPKKNMKYLLFIFGFCGVVMSGCVSAQAASITSGMTISPAIEQISLNRNQTASTYATHVTNNTTSPVVVSISAEGFTALNQTGSISFYNSKALNVNDPHGLLNYLHIANPKVIVQPGQTQTVPITIVNANKLTAGGHYAALLFSVVHLPSPKGNQVTINQVVSSLVFLSTYGKGTQSIALTTPVISSVVTSFPNVINMVFANTGNTQTTPRGYVQILDSRSKLISQEQINTDSSLILPQSKRLFTLSLVQAKKHLGPGIYYLKIYYQHDGQATYTTYEQRFYFVNRWVIVAAIVAVLFVLVLAARFWLPADLPYRLKRKP